MESLEEILKGLHISSDFTLKKEQKQCLEFLLNGYNVFSQLPTGYGKTLIFALYPLLMSKVKSSVHTCLVISPLKALMKDQVESLTKMGFRTKALTAETCPEDLKEIVAGNVDVLLASPEILAGRKIDAIQRIKKQICLLAFDECHCISEWGLDFRPEYRKICEIVSIFPKIPTLLLSATCTKAIKKDIFKQLCLNEDDTKVVAILPDRPNVFINIQNQVKEDFVINLSWLSAMVKAKKENTPKTIIFCSNLKACSDLYMWFMESLDEDCYVNGKYGSVNHRFIEMFHSRTDEDSVQRILTSFKEPKSIIRIVCATVAFGMGIDIPDVTYVINWGVPSTALLFWQQAGRCGRDGRQSTSIMYPYPRAISFCKDLDLKNILKSNSCYRKGFLNLFTLEDMEVLQSVNQECDKNCQVCTCYLCACCNHCMDQCKCVGKKEGPYT